MPDEVMDAAMRAGRDSGESGASAKVHAPYLVTRGLVKGYGEGAARMEVLRGIDVEIARGEICVLLGPSGSGKSTFLNLIGGLEAADGGSIEVGGTAITTLGKKRLANIAEASLASCSNSTIWYPILRFGRISKSQRIFQKTRSLSMTF